MSKSSLYVFLMQRARQQVLVPGENDCAIFQAECLRHLVGVDLAADFRGNYSTYRQGLTMLRSAGHKSPRALVETIARKISHTEAILGDLCFYKSAGGIVVGANAYLLDPRGGLGIVPVTKKLTIYRVDPSCLKHS